MTATGQRALPFTHMPTYASDFIAAKSNAAARLWLERTPDWPMRRLALWGPAGSGKTHLLRLWARQAGAAILAGPQVALEPPVGAVAVDDAHTAPERTLLHLLNAAHEAGYPVLLAAAEPPARWSTGLADLASRLRAVTSVGIGVAEDTLLRALLARLLADRQMVVAEAVQEWILVRLPRTAGAVRTAAARLDRLGMEKGGRVTRAEAARMIDEDFAQGSRDAGRVV